MYQALEEHLQWIKGDTIPNGTIQKMTNRANTVPRKSMADLFSMLHLCYIIYCWAAFLWYSFQDTYAALFLKLSFCLSNKSLMFVVPLRGRILHPETNQRQDGPIPAWRARAERALASRSAVFFWMSILSFDAQVSWKENCKWLCLNLAMIRRPPLSVSLGWAGRDQWRVSQKR